MLHRLCTPSPQPAHLPQHQTFKNVPSTPNRLLGWKMQHSYLCTVQVHKYWDIDTILTFLALYTTTMDLKWNEQDVLYVQTFSFHLRVFTSKSGERCRNYNRFYMCLPLFKGPKVMGQTNDHKSNFHFLILGCKSLAVNYSLKSGTHWHHQTLGFIPGDALPGL